MKNRNTDANRNPSTVISALSCRKAPIQPSIQETRTVQRTPFSYRRGRHSVQFCTLFGEFFNLHLSGNPPHPKQRAEFRATCWRAAPALVPRRRQRRDKGAVHTLPDSIRFFSNLLEPRLAFYPFSRSLSRLTPSRRPLRLNPWLERWRGR